jgi:phage terminase large subunit GpA-like protein
MLKMSAKIIGVAWATCISQMPATMRNNPKRRQWKRRTDRRNEALDCTVYALWLVHALRLHLKRPAEWDYLEERIQQVSLFDTVPEGGGRPAATPVADAAMVRVPHKGNGEARPMRSPRSPGGRGGSWL